MKNIFITLVYLLPCTFLCCAQDMIENGDFESHTSGCKNPKSSDPSDFDLKPFFDGKVDS